MAKPAEQCNSSKGNIMDHSDLGNRMKQYEDDWECRLMPMVPAIARLDGKAFHTFTKGLTRPFHKPLSDLMIKTTKHLVEQWNCCIGYTQSDEITLVWMVSDFKTELPFGGRVQKLCSVLAGDCSNVFNLLTSNDPGMPDRCKNAKPQFDCRVFSVPNEAEAANCLVWRELDATRNSVSMAAQSMFSHKELQGKNCAEMHDMMHEKGTNWNDYPAFFKRGSYIQRRHVDRPFTMYEIEKLPAKHMARTNPDLRVVRSDYIEIDMPPLTRVINRNDVIFRGEEPKILSDVSGSLSPISKP